MCNGINDFWKWCNTTIPTIFDNSMSYYEFLCKMAGALKSLADEVKSDEKDIDANKKAIEMLREQLNNLDIAPEVEAALQKMLDDGSLESIIDNTILGGVQNFQKSVEKSNTILEGVQNQNIGLAVECIRSFAMQNSKFTYGGPSFLTTVKQGNSVSTMPEIPLTNVNGVAKNRVSCSTITLIALTGIEYKNSRVASGSVKMIDGNPYLTGGSNVPSSGATIIDLYRPDIFHYAEKGETCLYASSLAHMLSDAGKYHAVAKTTIRKLQPGDIIFYKNAAIAPDKWKNIHHADFFIGFTDDGILVYSATNSAENPIVLVNRKYTDDYIANQMCGYGRIELCGNAVSSKDILDGLITVKTVNKTAPITVQTVKKTSMAHLRPYIVSVKADNFTDGTNIIVQISDTQEFTNIIASAYINPLNKNQYIGNDCYYTTLYYTKKASTAPSFVRFTTDSDAHSCRIVDAAILEFAGYPKML